MQDYELAQVTSETEWQTYHAIRRAVLFEARGRFNYDPGHEDEYKENHFPFLLKLNGEGIGTTRLDIRDNGIAIVRLVAIRADLQRQGHGRILAAEVENFARLKGIKILYVNAAPESLTYYQKISFASFEWDAAELAGISADCHQMRKILA